MDGISADVTRVVFDPSFASARPEETSRWFYGMGNLQSITGMSYLNTSEVTDMTAMFCECCSLTSVDVSHFNTAKVTSMDDMFNNCTSLISLDLSSFNTSMVTNMNMMFSGCNSLTSLDVRHFNTAKVKYMSYMFYECSSLTSLDLSSFNTSYLEFTNEMFSSCSNLQTIYAGSEWYAAAVTTSNDMFWDCISLVGGKGTTYDDCHVDIEYAHIDGGPSNPGYFTDPNPAPEAYACYTPVNTTLTFYCDTQRSSRPGTTYDLNTGTEDPGWYADGNCYGVTKVVFDSSFAGARPTTTSEWFTEMYSLTSIDGIQYLNTSEVTDMSVMFDGCESLSSLDVSNFNTAKVTNMSYMFNGCSSLTSLDLSNFNTAKVTGMKNMFNDCSGLKSLNLSSFNTSNVTSMYRMFKFCSSLTSLDVSSFNTSNVTDMCEMFYACETLTSLDLSRFNTAKATDMKSMFYSNGNLITIYAGNGWSTAAVTSSNWMFSYCTSLVGGKGTTYSASHVDKAYAHIDGGTSNPGYFSAKTEAYACYTPSNTTLTFYYDDQRTSRTGTTYDLNTGTEDPGWYADGNCYGVTKVVFDSSFAGARPTTTSEWFTEMYSLTSIDGIQYLNTSEVTDMSVMFDGCESLSSLDVSNFNTAKVTNMSYMFNGCSSLTSLDLSNFNTAKVTGMKNMFNDCSGLKSLNLSSFNTSNVTSMYRMFKFCSSLTSLDVSSFNTSNVTDMCEMFYACETLTSLDLSRFNTAKATDMKSMFYSNGNLITIYAGNGWSTAAVTSSNWMFSYCTSLVGGKGTTYSASHVDKAYAHIDGGTSNPGYFSEKGGAFLRGDVNGDGSVNISDVTALIDYLLSGNPSGVNLTAADANQDNSINISDVTSLIDYLLSGTWN